MIFSKICSINPIFEFYHAILSIVDLQKHESFYKTFKVFAYISSKLTISAILGITYAHNYS